MKKEKDTIYTLLNAVIEETIIEKSRGPEFRVSSLPYCSILDAEAKIEQADNTTNFEFQFYVEIGTVIHSLLQKYIPRIEKRTDFRVFGSWKDKTTEKIYEKCFLNKKLRKMLIAGNLEYVDMEFKYGNKDYKLSELSGHLDLLMMDNCGKNGKWHALEFKSTGNFIIVESDVAIKRGYFPQKKHSVQIESYCTLLNLCYDIRVNTYHLIYFSRNKIQETPSAKSKQDWAYYPFTYKFTKEMYQKRKQHILDSQAGIDAVSKFIKYEDKDVEKQLKYAKQVVNNKPCKTREDFNKIMKPAFFGAETCKHYKNGKCFRKGSMERHLVALKNGETDE